MAERFQPPPTWADPVLVDEKTQKAKFNPVWLKWFVDLVGILQESGVVGGIAHNSTTGLQGGSAGQFYHFTAAQNTYLGNFTAGTAAIVGTTVVLTSTLTINDSKILKTNTNFTNGAAAAVGTLLNAPAAGDPTKWIPIDDNGTTRFIPAW